MCRFNVVTPPILVKCAPPPRACGPRWWLPRGHGGRIQWRRFAMFRWVGLTHVMHGSVVVAMPALDASCTSYCLLPCVLSGAVPMGAAAGGSSFSFGAGSSVLPTCLTCLRLLLGSVL